MVPSTGQVTNWVGSWITARNGSDHAVGAETYYDSGRGTIVTYPTFWAASGNDQHLTESFYGMATAINASDQIIVVDDRSTQGSSSQGAYIWQAGAMTSLGSLGGTNTVAFGINDAGQVVGVSKLANGQSHGFIWQAGTMTDLGTLGGASSSAEAINNAGQVVGTSLTAAGALHAFIWQAGTMTDLGTLGGTSSMLSRPPYDSSSPQRLPATVGVGYSGGWLPNRHVINDAGQVVGKSSTSTGEIHAFLWHAGTMVDLGTAGRASAAIAVNASGQVAIDDGGVVLFDPTTCP